MLPVCILFLAGPVSWSWNHPAVYLADLTVPERQNIVDELPQISTREVNMQRETAVALEYMAFQLKRQFEEATRRAGAGLCKQQQVNLENTPAQIQPGSFGLAHGGLYYKFSCQNRTAESLELKDCWTDFVCQHSQLFTPHSSKVACSHYFPLTVQTRDGWVSLMLHLVW
ncbi:MAG: hypothetical protein GY696_01880 [Gammaproteobacteria bacterium]|nr:hypothetical protein [Gammaproteobacteria bacterium]